MGALRHLLEPIGPDIHYIAEDGSYEARWQSPCLTATMALMLREDLVEGRDIRLCQICDGWFVAADVRARYCSVKCRRIAERPTA